MKVTLEKIGSSHGMTEYFIPDKLYNALVRQGKAPKQKRIGELVAKRFIMFGISINGVSVRLLKPEYLKRR